MGNKVSKGRNKRQSIKQKEEIKKKSLNEHETENSKPELALQFDPANESNDLEDASDERVMTKEEVLGSDGAIRTYITIKGDILLVEWFVVSRVKKNIDIKINWNVVNLKFEGNNVGTEECPQVNTTILPLQKVLVGKVEIQDISDAFDFKVSADWKTRDADKDFLEKLEAKQQEEVQMKRGKGKVFVDESFQPIYKNLNLASNADKTKPIEFMGTNQFAKENVVIFDKDVEPTDIVNSNETAYFTSALAVLAEHNELIERIFVTKFINKNGKYILRICLNGEWKAIFIDQFLPCFISSKTLVYSKTKSEKLWNSYIEKLYAKILGDYESLKKVTAFDVLQDLTGFPVEKLKTDSIQSMDKIEKLLIELKDKKTLIFAVFEYKSYMKLKIGLTTNRAYPVVDYVDHERQKFIVFRNFCAPEFNWEGEWSINSPEWTDEMKSKVKPDFEKGKFWMLQEKSLKIFNYFGVCHLDQKVETRFSFNIYYEESKVYCDFFTFKVDSGSVIQFLCFYQSWEKVIGSDAQVDLGALVLEKETNKFVALLDPSNERHLCLNFEMTEGEYLVLPFSGGAFAGKKLETEHVESIKVALFSRIGDKIQYEVIEHEPYVLWSAFNEIVRELVFGSVSSYRHTEITQKSGLDQDYNVYILNIGILHLAALEINENLVGKKVVFSIDCSTTENLIPAIDSYTKIEQATFELEVEKKEFSVIAKFYENGENADFRCIVERIE